MDAEMIKAATLRAAGVKLMIFDVDGVLTDGSLHYAAEGEVIKTFNVYDGLGIKLLQQSGVATAIITARLSPIINKRATDLGIQYVFQGAHDKRVAFEALLKQANVSADACGFIGDDIIDLPIILRAGFTASVPKGHPEVTSRVHYRTQAQGGHGAVRELCEFILHAQGTYEAAIAPYLAGDVA
jgi:3-deoxy-D-manno-octulosonate 8-phosphate phosphatase (KDO 8-P phosphatase)